MGEKMMLLNTAQRERLMEVASRLSTAERAELSITKLNEISAKIDKVLADLHKENPSAFVTQCTYTDDKPEFTAINRMTKNRVFFDVPLTLHSTDYKLAIKTTHRYVK